MEFQQQVSSQKRNWTLNIKMLQKLAFRASRNSSYIYSLPQGIRGLLNTEYVALVSIKKSIICSPNISLTQRSWVLTLIGYCND